MKITAPISLLRRLMDIICLTKTQINWTDYISMCKHINGHAPTRQLDKSNIKLIEELALISSLSELSGKDHTPVSSIEKSQVFMVCISLSFLIFNIETEICGSLKHFELSNQTILLSGTLRDWLDTIVFNLTPQQNKIQRELFGRILIFLEDNGYKLVFNSYSKNMLKDGTFTLERKQ